MVPRFGLGASLGLATIGVALLAVTATSPGSEDGVVDLSVADQQVFALLQNPSGTAVSSDGGHTWELTPEEFPDGPRPDCTPDGVCWQIEDEVIQRDEGDGTWTREIFYSDEQQEQIEQDSDDGCRWAAREVVVTVAMEAGSNVLVNNGCRGVLVRNASGEWLEVGVGEFEPTNLFWPSWVMQLGFWAPLALG